MILTEKEKGFIKNNNNILKGIYSKKINGLIDDVLKMDMGKERDQYLEVVKLFKIELSEIGMISNNEKGEKTSFV